MINHQYSQKKSNQSMLSLHQAQHLQSSLVLHFVNLLKQCQAFGIEIIKDFPSKEQLSGYKLIIDSVFGYSFKGPLRGSWKERFPLINDVCSSNKIPIVAVDVPSGWNIDEGPHENDICLNVDILVSLS